MLSLAGYRLTEQLHDGERTLVFRARREADPTSLVLKTVRTDTPSAEQFSRWSHEYEVLKTLSAPAIPRAYELIVADNRPVLVLEDLGGRSLRQHLAGRALPLDEFFPLAVGLVEALAQVHAGHVVHRDLNPANLVIRPQDGRIHVIDFGIASLLASQATRTEGTLAYLSPEQTGRINRSVDYRTDFYSLGVTLYEMLTGRLPFTGLDRMELVHAHIARLPVPPHQLLAHISASLSAIVMKLLAKSAEERYQSCQGLQADVLACQAGQALPRLGRADLPDRLQVPQKLYGRQREIQAVLAAFERVAAGGVEMLLVGGHSGIGKSALVHETRAPIGESRGFFLAGKFEQYHKNRPYLALIQALAELARQILAQSEERAAHYRDAILEAVGVNGRLITELVPGFEALLGKQSQLSELPSAEAQNRFQLVLRNFVRCLGVPLVLVLDDLQWADLPTLEVLELLVTDREQKSLLVIGTYRDNQVDRAHPLMLTCEHVRQKGGELSQITLGPLSLEHLGELLADTLSCSRMAARGLARFFGERTNGNPFFVNQLLDRLYQQGAIHLKDLRWCWDLEQIARLPLSDSLAQLMADKIKTLPPSCQEVLKLAACLGHQFDLPTLARVCGKRVLETGDALWEAVRLGLIRPAGAHYPLLDGIRLRSELEVKPAELAYVFVHDQIQRAAYSLIEDSQKQQVHRTIGRLLLRQDPGQERIFETVSHLNLGQDPSQRHQRLLLNLRAGQQARRAAAYPSALGYFTTALELLGPRGWSRDYPLALEIHRETAEAAYLTADFEQVERLTGIVLKKARSVLDQVPIYDLKIRAAVAQRRLTDGVQTGFAALKLLGISFPEQPGPAQVMAELGALAAAVPAERIDELAELPPMTEPDKLAAMHLLSAVFSSAYLSAPQFLPFLVSQQVQLSARYGNSPTSAYAYATYGLILCGAVGDISSGYRFGTLALKLQERLGDPRQKCRVYHIAYTFTRPWKEHTRSTLRPLLEAYQSGLDQGDFEYAAYASLLHCYYSYFVGRELPALEHEIAAFAPVMQGLGQQINHRYLSIWHQAVDNLMGHSSQPTQLVGAHYNEAEMLAGHLASNDRTGLFFIYYNKMVLEYLFGHSEAARQTSPAVEEHLDAVVAVMCVALFYFYDSLIRLAVSGEAELERVESNLAKLRHWAEHAPMNYQHKVDLVEAELARVQGREAQAMRSYDRAIDGAASHHYLQEEALAYELAAEFYELSGLTRFARHCAGHAHSRYLRWGARAKADQLQTRMAHLLAVPAAAATRTGTQIEPTLDLDSVLKACQAISGEIVLEDLVDSLLQVAMENAGADRGLLLAQEAGRWQIVAQRRLDEPAQVERRELEALGEDGLPLVPVGLIHYVTRTREPVSSARYASQAYLKARSPRSLLCLPLLHQGQLVGILYLENHLTEDAFTSQSLEVLRLLSGQAAISLTNAQLWRELERKERQVTQFLEAVPVGIFVTDAQGQPTYVNSMAQQILGRGVAPGASPHQLAEIYQVYREGTDRLYPTRDLPIVQALAGKPAHVEDMEVQTGSQRRLLGVSATPVADEDGVIRYAIAAFQDITEQKRAQRLLEDYNRTLEGEVKERTRAAEAAQSAAEAANQAKSSFLANMSHEVRTPLNAIIGLTNLAMRADPPPKLADYLRKIRSFSRSLLGIINDILDFSRIEAGKLELDCVDFDLRELVESLDDLVGDEAHRKGIEFLVAVGPEVPCALRGDPLRLNQLLTNLVYNAVKFTHQGTILVRARCLEDGRIRFSVSDTGIGIEAEQLPRIFQSFTQIDGSTSRHYGGAGLGLSICRHLVELMGGSLEVVSAPGQGSTFSFTLELARQARAIEEPHLAASYRGQRVLVVDDNPLAGEILSEMLSSLGLRPTTVTSGEQALGELASTSYALVVLDWKMPGMDGIETARRIGAQGAPLQLILATAYDQPQVRGLAEQVGIHRILTKPVSQSALYDAIMEAFGQERTVAAPRAPSPAGQRLRGVRLLVVEDVEINQQITREILEHEGALVDVASDGREALRVVYESKFDAVLMDVQMPGMDGFEATRAIRSDPQFSDLPIIAITAHAMRGDRERCLAAGMNDHVTKPIHTPALLSVLSAYVTPQDPVLDLQEALEQFSGDMPRLLGLLQSFLKDYAGAAQAIRQALEQANLELARSQIHTLVGVAGNLRLKGVYSRALEVQLAVKQGEDWRAGLERLEQALSAVTRAVPNLKAPAQAEPEVATPSPVLGQVLVVDDDASNRTMIRGALERQGHRVVEASSGEEALALVFGRRKGDEASGVDAILLDVVMPGMDGFATCRTLKQDPHSMAIPVLLVTALEDRSDRLRGIRSGADDFISKPLDFHEVALRVNNAVRTKRIYDELQHNFQRLQRLEQLRDSLTHMLVHDLRTPLTGIIGYTQLLRRSALSRLEPEELGYLAQVREMSGSLVDMVSSILDVSRLENDELPLNQEAVDMERLAQEAIEGLGALEDRQVRLQAQEDLVARCDRELVGRVLTNLIANALRYTPAGEEVGVQLSRWGDQVEVRVVDQGPGIPPEQLERVFEKFAQLERHRHSSGLGLTFCKLVVEKHGGSIGVESCPGQGSQFWFRLNAHQPAIDDTPALLMRMGGSAANLKVVYDIFRSSRPQQLEQIERALSGPELERAVTTLRGSLQGMGAVCAVRCLDRLEQLARAREREAAGPAYRELEQELARLDAAIDRLTGSAASDPRIHCDRR